MTEIFSISCLWFFEGSHLYTSFCSNNFSTQICVLVPFNYLQLNGEEYISFEQLIYMSFVHIFWNIKIMIHFRFIYEWYNKNSTMDSSILMTWYFTFIMFLFIVWANYLSWISNIRWHYWIFYKINCWTMTINLIIL